PDLPKLKIGELEEFKNLKETIPELPQAKRERLTKLGIQAQDVEQYVGDPELSKFFDAAAAELKTLELIKISSNFIANDIAGQRRKEPDWPLPSLDHFVTVMRCFQSGELASPQAKSSILSGTMAKVADNESLHDLVGKTIAANPKVVGDFQQGKEAALQFLIGQGMKESHGAANPEALKKLFTERLGKPT
ncbi:MAG: hypothetical protein HYT48_03495, partial [Candidatus Vogelbacteria bacterium]|nr:hypothetical protein [Candidatus Vogelbacteria bacterium]